MVAGQLVVEFARQFGETHGMKISFTEAATAKLVSEAEALGRPVRDLCAERFKDYQFGLTVLVAAKHRTGGIQH